MTTGDPWNRKQSQQKTLLRTPNQKLAPGILQAADSAAACSLVLKTAPCSLHLLANSPPGCEKRCCFVNYSINESPCYRYLAYWLAPPNFSWLIIERGLTAKISLPPICAMLGLGNFSIKLFYCNNSMKKLITLMINILSQLGLDKKHTPLSFDISVWPRRAALLHRSLLYAVFIWNVGTHNNFCLL